MKKVMCYSRLFTFLRNKTAKSTHSLLINEVMASLDPVFTSDYLALNLKGDKSKPYSSSLSVETPSNRAEVCWPSGLYRKASISPPPLLLFWKWISSRSCRVSRSMTAGIPVSSTVRGHVVILVWRGKNIITIPTWMRVTVEGDLRVGIFFSPIKCSPLIL